jgi:hypothetical protein
LDFCCEHIRRHASHYDEAPDAIAIVTHSSKGYRSDSFSPLKSSDRLAFCAAAAALLLKRGTSDDA